MAGGGQKETDKGNGEGEGWEESSDNREGRWPIGTSLPWFCVIILSVEVSTKQKSLGPAQII